MCVCVCVCVCVCHVRLFATPWNVAHQVSLSVEFSRQEYWSGLPFPSSGDLPNPGTEPRCPALLADALHLSHQGSPESFLNLTLNLKAKRVDKDMCMFVYTHTCTLRCLYVDVHIVHGKKNDNLAYFQLISQLFLIFE